MTKQQMYEKGLKLLEDFCKHNDVEIPRIIRLFKDSEDRRERLFFSLNTCAFYRSDIYLRDESCPTICIMVSKCASIGTHSQFWSYPGYKVDRTPYGVLQHELGHYIDFLNQYTCGKRMKDMCNEKPITEYDKEKPHEVFAEMFRLFVTNPDLLARIRPKSFLFIEKELKLLPVVKDSWETVLSNAPERTIQATKNLLRE